MSTNTIIGIIVAIIVIGGGAWYFTSGKSGGTEAQRGASDEAKEVNAGEGTFASLVGRAGSWKCDIKTYVENAPSEGTVHISDGKVRADFTSVIGNETVTSHMISADGYVYTWSDAYPQGMKMKIPEGDATAVPGNQGGVSPDANVEYSCAPAGASLEAFVPPSSVSFMELGGGIPNTYPVGSPDLPVGDTPDGAAY